MFAGIGLEDRGITLEEFINDYWAKNIGIRNDDRKSIVTPKDIAETSKKAGITSIQIGEAAGATEPEKKPKRR